MKKILTVLLLSFFAISDSKAQITDSASAAPYIIAELMKIQYVFEGVITKIETYAGDEDGNMLDSTTMVWDSTFSQFEYPNLSDGGSPYCYSIATVRVCQTYKGGEYVYDTMRILTRNRYTQFYWYYDSTGNLISRRTENYPTLCMGVGEAFFKPGMEGIRQIFFAFDHTYSGISAYIKILSILGGIDFHDLRFNPSSDDEGDHIMASSGALLYYVYPYFYTRPEINAFLETIPYLSLDIYGTNICEAGTYKEKKNPKDKETLEKQKIDYKQNVKNYNDFLTKNLNKQKAAQKRTDLKLNKAGETLILEIANARVTGPDYEPWLEFDIMVSADVSGLFFDNCLMRITYDNAGSNKAFGSNIVSNANIQISRYSPFNTSTYSDPASNSVDQTSTTVGIPFGANFATSPLNRVQLTTTPQKMLKIRMKIAVKNKAAGISFVDLSTTSNLSYFAINANDNIADAIWFDNTQMNGSNNDLTCKPIISSFSTNAGFAAGIGEELTITGKYFGGPKSKNGTVIFKNANRGHVYPIGNKFRDGIDIFDIVSWTDDEIKIRVPCIIDSITDLPTSPNYQSVPGSGKFKVHNRFGVEGESTSELIIPYAIRQKINNTTSTYKYKVNLVGANANKGYTVYINHNVISTYPKAKSIIKKALKDWSCSSGIKWELGKDTSLGAMPTDKVCVITLDGSIAALMGTQPEVRECHPSTTYEYTLNAFDISINNNYSWQFDTTGALVPSGQFDFYEAIMHELGHAHLLYHVNDSLIDLMFYKSNPGLKDGVKRKAVKTSPDARDGADYVANNRVSSTNCTNRHIIEVPLHCTPGADIDNPIPIHGLNIYPNPVTYGYLTIDFGVVNSNSMSFVIFDFMGKQIQRVESNEISGGSYKLNVDNLAKGVYLLNVLSNNHQQSVKFIKQ
jgi:hypothetical protein